MKRRNFIQFAGSTLATLGLSQLEIEQQGDKYHQALGVNNGRKLALLVGINKYGNGIEPLHGCVNDVLLQKNLLIHRFGFRANDIKTLIDEQATRQGILTAFEQHLINQAKPGDTVVFHFSGHGSQIFDPDKDTSDGLNSTLVPVDSTYKATGGEVSDIMGHTLFLLMYALKTDNITVVLDSCHSGGAKRGNFIVRSRLGGSTFKAIPQEFTYQKQWLKRLNLSPQEFIRLRRKNVAKGVVIAAAKRDQYAADAPFNGFHAGIFTYALTQYLWQQSTNPTVSRVLIDVSRNTKAVSRLSGIFQDPEMEINYPQNGNPGFYFTHFNTSFAEGVVTKVQGDKVELWLGGIDGRSLEAFGKGSTFTTVNVQGKETGIIKLESRQGLRGQGKIITAKGNFPLQPGTFLQEKIRGIPQDLTLKIGLDDSFNIQAAKQARQALQKINRIHPVALGQQEIQYIFGRMTQSRYQQLQKSQVINLPPVGSLGLFLPSLDQIVIASFDKANETIPDAVNRLQGKLKSLLAVRIFKQMMGNSNSSLLKVTASFHVAGNPNYISQTLPTRGILKQFDANQSTQEQLVSIPDRIPQLPVGTQVVFNIENQESIPIYITILIIDAAGEMALIFPNNWTASADTALLSANEKKIIPSNEDNFKLTISKPQGISEALIIASTSPLRNTLQVFQEIATRENISRGPVATNNNELIDISDRLLADMNTRGGVTMNNPQTNGEMRGVDTNKIAVMAIAFAVVG